MRLNTKKLHLALRATLDEQTRIKARDTHYQQSWVFQRLSIRMTVLCELLAAARGTTHIKKLTKRFGTYGFAEPVVEFNGAQQEEFFQRLMKSGAYSEFLDEEEVQTTPDGFGPQIPGTTQVSPGLYVVKSVGSVNIPGRAEGK